MSKPTTPLSPREARAQEPDVTCDHCGHAPHYHTLGWHCEFWQCDCRKFVLPPPVEARPAPQEDSSLAPLRALPRYTHVRQEFTRQGGHYGEEQWQEVEYTIEPSPIGELVKFDDLAAAIAALTQQETP